MMPILHSPGVIMPGQFGPMRRWNFSAQRRLDPHHVDDRDAFRDANNQLNAGIGGLQDRIGRERARDENHRCVATGLFAPP